jgi:hypothetical protein
MRFAWLPLNPNFDVVREPPDNSRVQAGNTSAKTAKSLLTLMTQPNKQHEITGITNLTKSAEHRWSQRVE